MRVPAAGHPQLRQRRLGECRRFRHPREVLQPGSHTPLHADRDLDTHLPPWRDPGTVLGSGFSPELGRGAVREAAGHGGALATG